ncbi:MAG: DUF2510 domain-containing protein [Ilumatobacter sp.]|uniref:DUF2510 domain-containing protein n=1 Tax=Ilumatobacter sp. TaxID=1967498 RepID=UPI00329A6E9F
MQEFSSVTASSYDAESLAPMLTEKAGEGWSVVSIVSAGTNVVAYLTRGGTAPATDASAAIDAGIAEIEVNSEADAAVAAESTAISPSLPGDDAQDAPAAVTSSPEAVAAVEASGEPTGWGAVADTPSAADSPSVPDSPSIPDTPSVPTLPDSSDAGLGAVAGGVGATASAAAVGGAAVADDTTSPFDSTGDATDEAADTTTDAADAGTFGGSGGSADDFEGAAEHAGAVGTDAMGGTADAGHADAGHADSIGDATSGAADTDPTYSSDTSDSSDTEQGVADTGGGDDAGAASGVPAGWYADPSGRFELRYWDGNAWTEHVSRAGQQYTDPPVA